MRKLESKADIAKKRRRNSIIVGGILVAVMLFSVLGFGFRSQDNGNGGTSNKVNYNGLQFVNNGAGYWTVALGNFQFIFRYTPDKTNDTNATIPPVSKYSGAVLYINSQDPDSEREIYNNLRNIFLRSQPACLDPGNNTGIEVLQPRTVIKIIR